MTTITFKKNPIETVGILPKVGSQAPDFTLVRGDLSEAHLSDFPKQWKILNIFPSLDTGVCSLSVKQFNQQIADYPNVVVLNISKDLPFAQARFCKAENITHADTLSAFRSPFAKDYGLEIKTGGLTGLCSRAVIVLDENNKVVYVEQVPEIAQEPDYIAALGALKNK